MNGVSRERPISRKRLIARAGRQAGATRGKRLITRALATALSLTLVVLALPLALTPRVGAASSQGPGAPDGLIVVCEGENHTLRLVEIKDGKGVSKKDIGDFYFCVGMALSRDGGKLAVATADEEHLSAGLWLVNLEEPGYPAEPLTRSLYDLGYQDMLVTGVTFNPTGDLIYLSFSGGEPQAINAEVTLDGELRESAIEGAIWDIDPRTGDLLVARQEELPDGGFDERFYLVDRSGRTLREFGYLWGSGEGKGYVPVSFSPDGDRVLAWSSSGDFFLLDRDFNFLERLGSAPEYYQIGWSRDGSALLLVKNVEQGSFPMGPAYWASLDDLEHPRPVEGLDLTGIPYSNFVPTDTSLPGEHEERERPSRDVPRQAYCFGSHYYCDPALFRLSSVGMARDSAEALSRARYPAIECIDKHARDAHAVLDKCTVLFISGHGNEDSNAMLFSDERGEKSLLMGGYYRNTDDVACIGNTDLSGLELAVFEGCQTARDLGEEDNLLNTCVAKGVGCAIGFSTSISNLKSQLWPKLFWSYLLERHMTIRDAALRSAADTHRKWYWLGYGIDETTIVVVGEGKDRTFPE